MTRLVIVALCVLFVGSIIAKKCDENEEYVCKTSCPPETCSSMLAFYDCDQHETCTYNCYCKDGFYRAHETAECRPACECAAIVNTRKCQQKMNEEHQKIPSLM